GLRAVPAGPDPIVAPGQSLVSLDGPGVVLTALKPADRGAGVVARVLNPTDEPADASLQLDVRVRDAVAIRLDEQPADGDELVQATDRGVRVRVPPHALRSVWVRPS
ncbi:MAG TPA: glycosyl hydrolase-related protein, partial [Acidimicrobiia bacterium]|nr:glycosyl hydrolase-related protein [Acidimicrobiia bacterium]